MDQYALFDFASDHATDEGERVEMTASSPLLVPDLASYDTIIVAMSGGKDSIACALNLRELGYGAEFWHHDIDGRGDAFMDWPITPSYNNALAAALGAPIYHSWRVGGLKRELLKENDRIAPVQFETPEGLGEAGGINGKIATRRRFPSLTSDLRTRWCSPVAKIDVMAAAIANQSRFIGQRILVITGERAQESAARSKYATLEPHRNHSPGPRARRHVDHWRPIHGWTEEQVWAIMERHGIRPHPCYELGWGRASCLSCIFGSKNQWASIRLIAPERFAELAALEVEFGHTLRKGVTLHELADMGTPYDMDPDIVRLALSDHYDVPIIMNPWKLPKGAYGESAGPT